MELFKNKFTIDYTNENNTKLLNAINNLTDTEITTRDLQELEDYFYQKFYIETISIFKDNIASTIEKSTFDEYNPFFDNGNPIWGNRTYTVDSYKITYSLPFSGNSDLLYLQPSRSILSTFKIDNIEYNRNCYPTIIYSLNIAQKKLEAESNPQEYLEKLFAKEFSNYFSMIEYINYDISNYNNTIRGTVQKKLKEKFNKAYAFSSLLQKITIPLKINSSTPNLNQIPITLKKVPVEFPKEKTQEQSWVIADSDYSNIKNILSSACLSFEHAPSAYQKLNEEELRDVLLSNLNTHYNSLATGETFSKNGKTDIRIQFENKSAYIAECKIWHGISEFKKAIEQLFSYTTWRDIKTSLIIFNKDIKDFKSIITKIDFELNTNELKVNISKISKNEWQCTLKKSLDLQELIQLHIIICDIKI